MCHIQDSTIEILHKRSFGYNKWISIDKYYLKDCMMNLPYLLVARAEKIQSFIFQSAKLKEVVGASFKLREFGENVSKVRDNLFGLNIAEPADLLTFRGGNFRIVYHTWEEAVEAGWKLREAFEKEVGGTLVVYEPTPYPSDEQARKPQIIHEPVGHFPLQAICQSTGIYPAREYKSPYPGEETKYLSLQSINRAKVSDARDTLFGDLLKHIDGEYKNKKQSNVKQPFDADAYTWDSRQYVAYLVADGNKMGEMFKNCMGDTQKASNLSDAVSDVVNKSLANAVQDIRYFAGQMTTLTNEQQDAFEVLPVLPLILGGDDIFILMPASWAVHVAKLFCEKYQKEMTAIAKELNVLPANDNFATIGVAVVICKASYPYKSAHEYGEALLEMVKLRAKESNESRLYVDIILGSTQPENTERLEQHPFYTPDAARILLNARYLYKNIPQRQLYTALEHGETEFSPELLPLDADEADWNEVTRLFKEHLFYQDLIGLWDFTHNLHRDLSEYTADK